MTGRLTLRALNRATLERQLLTRRTRLPPLTVIERLTGLQAQDPDPPYIGLWSRIDGFRIEDLTTLLEERAVVRATLFRGTQHLVTADDYLWVRPLLQPMLDRWQKGGFGRQTAGLDLGELAAAARNALSGGRTLTRPELGRLLAERWPGRDPVALARSVQGLLPVVHPPPDGTWGRRGPTPFAPAEEWLGRPLARDASVRRLVLRYLAGFGPATVKDVQAWSGATRLRAVLEELRPRLRVFRAESGEELFDLPDAPRPGPDREVPVRFLAALDNVVLGHADRSRLMTDDRRPYVVVEPAVLVDGVVRALWGIRRQGATAVLTVKCLSPLGPREEAEVTDEGARLLRFAAADAERHDIRCVPVDAG
ncbi:winged helix DNA-binding domain-containing protein [Streptomyces sp. MMS20-AI2-20]|uniref:winged helix DNA-binding domain-containing protein n=1 Tax=Streptomyces sp. MMS20-AI2-20 TaxID=2925835 RepID=UPI001F621765|nr:winged helix DNA-binding domain-containing protein [Streptomyces sp. MMS20-AI2-20]MCI4145261.1 winged helix DNA-binding domain-containing protein [Streptomyces sp. MMS20-AI2-20]